MPLPAPQQVLPRLTLEDKVLLLRRLAPRRADALEVLLDDVLCEIWPKRTPVWIKARLKPRVVKLHA